jgi:hypothetical protein
MRYLYHTPLKYLITISPESSGRRLTTVAEGEPGIDWQAGAVYDKGKPMPVKFKDDDGRIARQLWERSEEMLLRVGVPIE